MALEFDKIPSEVSIKDQEEINRKSCNVEEEILERRKLLMERTTQCPLIRPFRITEKPDAPFLFKFICVCPQFNPCYPCKHTGNVIIDRDVLTKAEHLCFLATPKPNLGHPRKTPRFYHKRILLPFASARIAQLARPKKLIVRSNIELYEEILENERIARLRAILDMNYEDVQSTDIETALAYITEENRLGKVAKEMNRRKCRKLKRMILKKQKRQIKKIVCVLFEELKDFLLNDQFLIDECSMLTRVILEKIREFTDNDFYSTSNLREYQKILANNMAVWINKFVSALSIFVTQPDQPEFKTAEVPEPDTFLPVWDYMSLSDQPEEEQEAQAQDGDFISAVEEEVREIDSKELQSIQPMDYDKEFAAKP